MRKLTKCVVLQCKIESLMTCKGVCVCVCVCLYDSNTHDSTEVQMECIPKRPLSLHCPLHDRVQSEDGGEPLQLCQFICSWSKTVSSGPRRDIHTFLHTQRLVQHLSEETSCKPKLLEISVVLRMSVVCAVFLYHTYTMQVVILWSEERTDKLVHIYCSLSTTHNTHICIDAHIYIRE